MTHVLAGAPAEQAGFEAGDLLLQVDEKTIDSDAELGNELASRSVGERLSIVRERNGKRTRVELVVGQRPAHLWQPAGRTVRDRMNGLAFQTLTPTTARYLGFDPSMKGAVVVFVPIEDWRFLRPNDIIVGVAGKPWPARRRPSPRWRCCRPGGSVASTSAGRGWCAERGSAGRTLAGSGGLELADPPHVQVELERALLVEQVTRCSSVADS